MPWSPHATTREKNLQATTREKPEHRNKETACLNEKRFHMPQQRSHVPQLRPDAAKIIIIIIIREKNVRKHCSRL